MKQSDPRTYTNRILRILHERGPSTHQEVRLALDMEMVKRKQSEVFSNLRQLELQGRVRREGQNFVFVRFETRRELKKQGFL